jgi:hypothetical protein
MGIEHGDRTGSSLALGDVNGDGMMDMAIAASGGDGASNGSLNAGEVSIVLGAVNLGSFDLDDVAGNVLRVYGTSNSRLGAHPLNLAFGDLSTPPDGRADLCAGAYLGGAAGGGRIDCFEIN